MQNLCWISVCLFIYSDPYPVLSPVNGLLVQSACIVLPTYPKYSLRLLLLLSVEDPNKFDTKSVEDYNFCSFFKVLCSLLLGAV